MQQPVQPTPQLGFPQPNYQDYHRQHLQGLLTQEQAMQAYTQVCGMHAIPHICCRVAIARQRSRVIYTTVLSIVNATVAQHSCDCVHF
jgi:hypothetical protein